MNGMLCNIVLFHLFKSQTERLWTGNTNIEYIFQQFASEIFKQLPKRPANINFCNKQCTLQIARVDLANEIVTTSGK